MRSNTQTFRIVQYMLDNGSITSWEAIKEFGLTRLGSCIFNLRKNGFFIDSEIIYTTNRYGQTVRYAKYTLDTKKTFNFENKLENIDKIAQI